MLTHKRIWLAISLSIIVFFIWGIPLGTYEGATVTICITGAVLLFISLFQYCGEYTSFDQIFKKQDPKIRESRGRRLSPFMVIPAIAFLLLLLVNFNLKKSYVLNHWGVLAKGTVVSGQTKSTTRKFKTRTSYKLKVKYIDSLGAKHYFNETVSAEDFYNTYQNEEVDIVYWREDPRIAKVVFKVEEIGNYKEIVTDSISVMHLTTILEGKINDDSIKDYLNTINYEWVNVSDSVYQNSKLNLGLLYSKEGERITYMQQNSSMGFKVNEDGSPTNYFEKTLIQNGFKIQAAAKSGQLGSELYYSDTYVVQKNQTTEFATSGSKSYTIYSLSKLSK